MLGTALTVDSFKYFYLLILICIQVTSYTYALSTAYIQVAIFLCNYLINYKLTVADCLRFKEDDDA